MAVAETHPKVVVEADGGSRGNPGPAGYGAVVYDPDTGEVLAEVKDSIGVATNNVAEYRGLIAGLTAARALGAEQVAVRMDSKLVVEQMKGAWSVKNEGLKPLARQAQALRREFPAITFEWIPREKNKHADRLANEAMDAAAGIAAKAPRVKSSPRAGAQPAATGSWGPPTDRAARLVLVRHGSTEHSAARKFSGRNALPLDAAGRAQAAALARRDVGELAAVLTSPLDRAVQTAEAIASARGLPVETVEGLVETDFGAWEGRTSRDLHAEDPDALERWRSSLTEAPPGGESFADVQQRVEAVLRDVVAQHTGRTVAVVSHVTPIKMVLGVALRDVEAALFRIHLDTASVSIVDFYADGNASVRLVNDTSHLRAP